MSLTVHFLFLIFSFSLGGRATGHFLAVSESRLTGCDVFPDVGPGSEGMSRCVHKGMSVRRRGLQNPVTFTQSVDLSSVPSASNYQTQLLQGTLDLLAALNPFIPASYFVLNLK